MDITFKTDEGLFNYRVCAIIVHDNKLLAMKDKRSPYYYLPGGRVNLHETAESAILRELKEELNIEAKIERPLWFNQSFFIEDVKKEKFHELCLYFLIDISNTDLLSRGDVFTTKDEKRTYQYEWLDFKKLETEYLYPLFIKEEIFNLPKHLTILSKYEYWI